MKNGDIAEINANKRHFDDLVKQALSEAEEQKKLDMLAQAAFWATYNVGGCLNSKKIEDELVGIAQQHGVELAQSTEQDTVLHVMTACWVVGGHTQVVRRWVENSPSTQKHSVVFISQPNPETDTPVQLKNAVRAKNGDLIYLDKSLSFVEKALKLRQIASGFEKIILHVHMEDIVPILAFGTQEFKRPIVYFNHGDHLFWLGVSIADLVVNFRTSAAAVSKKFRKVKNNYVLPLPIDEPDPKGDDEDNNRVKEELGFSPNAKVIMTMASSYKYKRFDNYDFAKTIGEVLRQDSNIVFLAIGPELGSYWQNLVDSFPDRVKILGYVCSDEVDKYLKIADVAIDSFPFSSFVALMDIAKYGVPCLSLRTPLNDLDCFEQAGIICETQEELATRIIEVIKQNGESSLYSCLKAAHMGKAFQQELGQLHSSFPQTHALHEVIQDEERDITDLEVFVYKSQKASSNKPKKGFFHKLKSVVKSFAYN